MKDPPPVDKRQRSLLQFFTSKNKDQNQNDDLNSGALDASKPTTEDQSHQPLDTKKDNHAQAEHNNPGHLDSLPSKTSPPITTAPATADNTELEAAVADPLLTDAKNHAAAPTLPTFNAFDEFKCTSQQPLPAPKFAQRNLEKSSKLAAALKINQNRSAAPTTSKQEVNGASVSSISEAPLSVPAASPSTITAKQKEVPPPPKPKPQIKKKQEPEPPNAYELERLERIRRNMEVMKSLGLGAGGNASLSLSNNNSLNLNSGALKDGGGERKNSGSRQRKRPRSFEERASLATGPVRRSQRNIGSTNADGAASMQVDDDNTAAVLLKKVQEEEEPLSYDDSSVHRYVCQVMAAASTQHQTTRSHLPAPSTVALRDASPPFTTESSIQGFQRLSGMLVDASLARAYSIDYHERSGLLAAAGKDGRVALWGTHKLTTHKNDSREEEKEDEEEREKKDEGDDDDEEMELEPLLSCKLHKGWISDVQLWQNTQNSNDSGKAYYNCSGGGGNTTSAQIQSQDILLLSAGNDGIVCLWDITKTASTSSGLPQCLARSDDLHTSGVFSMHVAGQNKVLTGSKDCSVVVSTFDTLGSLNTIESSTGTVGKSSTCSTFSVVQRYDDLHDGCVVKCVRWKPNLSTTTVLDSTGHDGDTIVFASCGNDRAIRLVDTRIKQSNSSSGGGGGGNLVLEGEHSTTINHIRWSPASEHVLLSASHDPTLLLHDLRKPKSAVFSYTGHSPLGKRINNIYQPVFVAGGAAIATAGDPADQLSLYSAVDGKTISRGEVDINIGATFSGGSTAGIAPLFCSSNRCVAMFAPLYSIDKY